MIVIRYQLAWILVLFFFRSVLCVDIIYKEGKSNLDGVVLILDVGSLNAIRPSRRTYTPLIKSTEACRGLCKLMPKCNAWIYCTNPDGCGKGCSSYVTKNPTMAPCEDDTLCVRKRITEGSLTLPITNMGPYGTSYRGADCHPGAEDAWPWGTCTLKTVADPDSPKIFEGEEGSGWVSGTIKVPQAECAGISAAACERCHLPGVVDSPGCVRCAATLSTPAALLMGILDYGRGDLGETYSQLSRPEGCGSCYLLTDSALQQQCLQCLRQEQECGACALAPTLTNYFSKRQTDNRDFVAEWANPGAVATCVSCVQKYGEDKYGACAGCAAVAATQGKKELSSCLDCVDKMASKLCGKGVWPKDRSNCVSSPEQDTFCYLCATSGLFDQCLACGMKQPFYGECFSCGFMSTLDMRRSCFNCVDRAPASYRKKMENIGGMLACNSCLISDSFLQSGCERCLMTAPQDRFEVCLICHETYYNDVVVDGAANLRARCYSCAMESQKDAATCSKG